MVKVFRLHTDGNNNLVGWGDSSAYGNTAIRGIKDPNGATSKKEITSIPSPFARMDLVKTAFKVVTESKELDGDSIHHKLVSDCFDVGEIFFALSYGIKRKICRLCLTRIMTGIVCLERHYVFIWHKMRTPSISMAWNGFIC